MDAPDDSLSSSELRRRYKQLPDDQLSASQLRSRQAIPGNTFEHQTQGGGLPQMLLAAVIAAVLLLSAAMALQGL